MFTLALIIGSFLRLQPIRVSNIQGLLFLRFLGELQQKNLFLILAAPLHVKVFTTLAFMAASNSSPSDLHLRPTIRKWTLADKLS